MKRCEGNANGKYKENKFIINLPAKYNFPDFRFKADKELALERDSVFVLG